MNEYIETAIKIKDTVSEYIPTKLSVIIKLAELAFDTFGKNEQGLNALYKRAFKEAVENAAKEETTVNVRKLLNNCKSINSLEDVQNLTEYLKKVSIEMDLSLTGIDFSRITSNIAEKFECILLEERYDKLYTLLSRKPNTIDSDIQDIKEMLNEICDKTYRLDTDNKAYAKDFVSPLFMHRYNPIIVLKDIFVMPNVQIKKNVYNALDIICDFINSDDNVLFIEGCGGYGKSSIVSFIAYNYLFNNTNPQISFLNNKMLIVIKLREYNGESKINEIKKKLNNIDAIENDAILIFDGLDEVCMIDNSKGSDIAKDIIKEFSYYNRKIIITTRPTCMNYDDIDSLKISYVVAEVCCFNEIQRNDFADSFEKKDKRHRDAIKYIKNLPLEKKKNESIYGSPFLLYLVLSGGIKEEEKDNSWLLMHRLFHDDLFNPPYGFNRGIDHDTANRIYQFNCDIAYEMFKTNNQKLFMTNDEMEKILPNNNIKNTVKESHGLFSYMRKYNTGAIEFVHNHVRDYFLCEKILREINKWYSEPEIDWHQVALKLGELLKYSKFNNEVKIFISEAIAYNEIIRQVEVKRNDDEKIKTQDVYCIYKFLLDKCDREPIAHIFNWFYQSGGIVKYDLISLNYQSYKELSTVVLNNSACIYKIIYDLQSKENEYIYWVDNALLRKGFCNPIFGMIKEFLNKSDLSWINFLGEDFSNSNFSKSDLRNTAFYMTDLSYADLHGTKMQLASLKKVNLQGAILINASLYEANLSEAYMYRANLENAKLRKTNLRGATLIQANLCGASLREANLTEADLYCANFSETNLFGADFCEANLRGADLRYAKNITDAKFKRTIYDDSTLFPYYFVPSEPQFIKIV